MTVGNSTRILLAGTAFGYGPVAKACAVSRRLLNASTFDLDCVYLGDGHDVEFARLNGAFTSSYNVADIDLEVLSEVRAVVSFGRFDLSGLPLPASTPIILVDSLGWLWESVPDLAKRCHTYVVQDFLLSSDDHTRIARDTNLMACSPILDEGVLGRKWEGRDNDRLLVSFGGVDNPVVPVGACDPFIYAMSSALATLAPHAEVTFCLPRRIAESLRGDHMAPRYSFEYLGHDEFIDAMAQSTLLLTTPGLTASLEAMSLGVPARLLPPLNYSQLRIYGKYGLDSGIETTFAHRSKGLGIEDEVEGVRAVIDGLRSLTQDGSRVEEMAGQLLNTGPTLAELAMAWPYPRGDGADEIRRLIERVLLEL